MGLRMYITSTFVALRKQPTVFAPTQKHTAPGHHTRRWDGRQNPPTTCHLGPGAAGGAPAAPPTTAPTSCAKRCKSASFRASASAARAAMAACRRVGSTVVVLGHGRHWVRKANTQRHAPATPGGSLPCTPCPRWRRLQKSRPCRRPWQLTHPRYGCWSKIRPTPSSGNGSSC